MIEFIEWIQKISDRYSLTPLQKYDLTSKMTELVCKHKLNKKVKYNKESNKEGKSMNNNQSDNDGPVILRPNEHGNFCFPGTDLIFKSPTEKYIVAKQGSKGEWLELHREDIKECKRRRLRYKVLDLTFKGYTK
jgi:hypothetical protein